MLSTIDNDDEIEQGFINDFGIDPDVFDECTQRGFLFILYTKPRSKIRFLERDHFKSLIPTLKLDVKELENGLHFPLGEKQTDAPEFVSRAIASFTDMEHLILACRGFNHDICTAAVRGIQEHLSLKKITFKCDFQDDYHEAVSAFIQETGQFGRLDSIEILFNFCHPSLMTKINNGIAQSKCKVDIRIKNFIFDDRMVCDMKHSLEDFKNFGSFVVENSNLQNRGLAALALMLSGNQNLHNVHIDASEIDFESSKALVDMLTLTPSIKDFSIHTDHDTADVEKTFIDFINKNPDRKFDSFKVVVENNTKIYHNINKARSSAAARTREYPAGFLTKRAR